MKERSPRSYYSQNGNKINGVEWGDPVEDRAYKHQYAMFEKLGITSRDEIFWTAQTYMEDALRMMVHLLLSQPEYQLS